MVVFQSGGNLFSLFERGRQGLVAVNVLLVGDGGKNGRAMLIVRRADIDDVDVRIFRDIMEIGGGLNVVTDFVRILACAFRMGGADHCDFGFVARQIKEQRDVQMPVGVDFTNETATDETDTICFHSCFSEVFWEEGGEELETLEALEIGQSSLIQNFQKIQNTLIFWIPTAFATGFRALMV